MKIYKSIHAAVNPAQNPGTTFYSATVDDIIDAYGDVTLNAWIRQAFVDRGLDAIDYDHNLYGSAIIDDVLYICVTDGYDIEVNGEEVDPEEALSEYTPEDLSDYIKPATAEIIRRYITEYELKTPDFESLAIDLLRDGHTFSKLVTDYMEFENI